MAKNFNLSIPLRNKFPAISTKFKGELRDNQMIVRREAIDILEKIIL